MINKNSNIEITWIRGQNDENNNFINKFVGYDDNIFKNSCFRSITEK